MRILITGYSGFVAGHFVEYLEKNRIKSEVLGMDINQPGSVLKKYENLSVSFIQADMLDMEKLAGIVKDFKPEYILHLASYSSVGFSWKNPSLSFLNNVNIFLNLLEVVRGLSLKCRILSVGSSEVYGHVREKDLPMAEDNPVNPSSPYGAARIAQENLSGIYAEGFGLDIVMTRSFNHIGPGQGERFVVASFAKQLAEMKRGIRAERKLVTGDVSVVRDFLDVRDVVDAYYRILISGKRGEVYNVCSGEGVELSNIIDILSSILDINVERVVDSSLIRPVENRVVIGTNLKIKRETGWEAEFGISESLEDIAGYWLNLLK